MNERFVVLDDTFTLVEFMPGKFSLRSTKTGALLWQFQPDLIARISAALANWDRPPAPVAWQEPEPLPELVQAELFSKE